jgi:hypothetical protein
LSLSQVVERIDDTALVLVGDGSRIELTRERDQG